MYIRYWWIQLKFRVRCVRRLLDTVPKLHLSINDSRAAGLNRKTEQRRFKIVSSSGEPFIASKRNRLSHLPSVMFIIKFQVFHFNFRCPSSTAPCLDRLEILCRIFVRMTQYPLEEETRCLCENIFGKLFSHLIFIHRTVSTTRIQYRSASRQHPTFIYIKHETFGSWKLCTCNVTASSYSHSMFIRALY